VFESRVSTEGRSPRGGFRDSGFRDRGFRDIGDLGSERLGRNSYRFEIHIFFRPRRSVDEPSRVRWWSRPSGSLLAFWVLFRGIHQALCVSGRSVPRAHLNRAEHVPALLVRQIAQFQFKRAGHTNAELLNTLQDADL
jgi:hypothetical protein